MAVISFSRSCFINELLRHPLAGQVIRANRGVTNGQNHECPPEGLHRFENRRLYSAPLFHGFVTTSARILEKAEMKNSQGPESFLQMLFSGGEGGCLTNNACPLRISSHIAVFCRVYPLTPTLSHTRNRQTAKSTSLMEIPQTTGHTVAC